jgi:hypothetical protein
MNDYELKQAARRERLEARAAALRAESERRFNASHAIVGQIPMGQPILVGHHSEKRHRAALARSDSHMRKGVEAYKAAQDAEARADAVGSGGISSDDPDAVVKLREQLERMEAKHRQMKAVNAAHKAYKAGKANWAAGLNEAEKAHVTSYVPAYSWEPHPIPPYRFQNHSANMRRIKQRLEQLTASAGREQQANVQCAGFIVGDNKDANRIQILFPGKPSEAVRSLLKSHGFHWNRGDCCWQRMYSDGLWHSLTAVDGYIRKAIEGAA